MQTSGARFGWAGVLLACVLAGCGTFERAQEQEAARRTEKAQTAAQVFADEYLLRVQQASDRMYPKLASPRQREILSRQVLGIATAAATIPTGSNPSLNAVNMVVVATLNYEVGQRTVPRDFGPAGDELLEAYRWAHDEAWERVDRAVTPEQAGELRGLIDEWVRRNPDVEFVSLVRMEDFVEYRRSRGSDPAASVLGLLTLDPFAGLSDTNREIRESRLFAERSLFFAQRVPTLLSLQLRATIDAFTASATGRQLLDALERNTASAERITAVAQGLPATLEAERMAALEQAAALVEAERTAALEQAGEQFAAQSERLLGTFAAEQEGVRDTLGELRGTVESATVLSESLRGTIEAAGALRPEGREPLDLAELRSTLEAADATVGRLNELAASLGGLLGAETWESRRADYVAALAETEQAGARLVDRAFTRALVLAVVLVVGVFGAVALGRLVGRRAG